MKKYKKWIIGGGIGFVMILLFAISGGGDENSFEFVVAARDDLIYEVSITGTVHPVNQVDLAFEQSGTIAGIYGNVGDEVVVGQILISQDDLDIFADLEQARADAASMRAGLTQDQAGLEVQEAKLDELQKGTQAEEIKITETKVQNAAKALTDAETNLANVQEKADTDLGQLYDEVLDILNGAYTKATDAVSRKTDAMFINDDINPDLSFSILKSSASVESKVESSRSGANVRLNAMNATIYKLSDTSGPTEYDTALSEVHEDLSDTTELFDLLDAAIGANSGLEQATIDTYKANANDGRSSLNTAISNINAHQQEISLQKVINQNNISAAEASLNTAQNTLNSANAELTLKRANTRPEQITAQEAQVKQAKAAILAQEALIAKSDAGVQSAQAKLRKRTLYSPINGIITKQEGNVGEIATATTNIVSIMSNDQFHIEAFITEVDIASVSLDDTAAITLDAYGDAIMFPAKVISLDPAETVIDGVTTYKTTLEFLEKDDRIRSGMTANVDILAERRDNIIAVPRRAVIRRDNETYVRLVQSDGTFAEALVTVGLSGSDGRIEILEGISEGDSVVTFLDD